MPYIVTILTPTDVFGPLALGNRAKTRRAVATITKGHPMNQTETNKRLEYLRGELRAERISWGELAELQSLADRIDPGDAELLEAAGVPEHGENSYYVEILVAVTVSAENEPSAREAAINALPEAVDFIEVQDVSAA